MSRWRVPVVAALFVLAGCTALSGVPTSGGVDRTPAWTGDADNPWREAELSVAINDTGNGSRDYRSLVVEALGYWERNAERYAGYPIAYRLVKDPADADIVVSFVDRVACGHEDHAAGCAPVVGSAPVQRPAWVRVRAGLSDASTVGVLRHELGHTLGLGHGAEPREVMRPRSNLTTLPRRDATERALAWDSPTLSVHVDDANVSAEHRATVARQVEAVLGYFAAGANGTVPENVSFVRTDDRSRADVVIRFADRSACLERGGKGSCGRLFGADPDGDGALETYTRLEVTLVDLDPTLVAWHVGRWLGTGFGFEAESEYPPSLRESAGPDERRSDWWA